MIRALRFSGPAALTLALLCAAATPAPPRSTPVAPQKRVHGERIPVRPDRIEVDDGDTVVIRWSPGDSELVRVLGIDAPETAHPDHDIPYAQPWGAEARAFARGAFAAAERVELVRAATLDAYGRTLGYLFLGDRNYSVLLLEAHLAAEDVSHFGDNGRPREAAEVVAAARRAGPPPFEPPYQYRARMREIARAKKDRQGYPED